VEHHTAHAASAFYVSPFERAAVLTLDGRGERATTTYSLGDGLRLERLGQVDMPHSLGLLYERVTAYLGFLPSADEHKVMALASFGKPRYRDVFHDIVQCYPGGWYTINDIDLEDSLGPRRRKGEPLEERHFDIAHSLQSVLEESVLHICHWLHKKTQSKNLCLAGGVALNCVMNARLRDCGPFDNVWVQPAAGDAGTALGAALWIDIRESEQPTRPVCVAVQPNLTEVQ
jgi:carbamoyltransferase